jgi:hypothetical protein
VNNGTGEAQSKLTGKLRELAQSTVAVREAVKKASQGK